jgi:phosphatidylserine decarboxylase
MRIPLTKYGWPQVAIFPAIILAAMAILLFLPLPLYVTIVTETTLAVILIWVFSFFRDPYRIVPSDKNLLLSPADGTIHDIETVHNDFIGGPALRIGIFLSIFDVHINRSPCSAKIEKITYRKGQFRDARDPQAGQINESNDLYLTRIDSPGDKLIVRQISGAIARRIVCRTSQGEQLACGRQFGMIKFGSRTELYAHAGKNIKILVKIGDKVKAGLTPLAKYEI